MVNFMRAALNAKRKYLGLEPLDASAFLKLMREKRKIVDFLQGAGQLRNLRGLLYFTDGMGIYPTRRPPYETAFILLAEPPMSLDMPRWAIRLMPELPEQSAREQLDESVWIEDILAEMPEL